MPLPYSSLLSPQVLSLSSTAIVLQSTQEAKQMNTKAGQSILSVLISQDIAVIPIFAILPLLIVESVSSSTNTSTHQSFIGDLPGFAQAIIILVTICLMIIFGKFTLRYIFRYIAKTKLAEIFTALVLDDGISTQTTSSPNFKAPTVQFGVQV